MQESTTAATANVVYVPSAVAIAERARIVRLFWQGELLPFERMHRVGSGRVVDLRDVAPAFQARAVCHGADEQVIEPFPPLDNAATPARQILFPKSSPVASAAISGHVVIGVREDVEHRASLRGPILPWPVADAFACAANPIQ